MEVGAKTFQLGRPQNIRAYFSQFVSATVLLIAYASSESSVEPLYMHVLSPKTSQSAHSPFECTVVEGAGQSSRL